MPDGVVNIVNGGAETGELLTDHPGVDKISFTGSTAVGARIAASCGSRIRRCSTELGGKSAAIVLPDAPLETTVPGLVAGVMGNNGQLCAALTRILLPRSRYDDFVAALTSAVAGLVVGDPADRATDIGPLINQAARDRVEGFLRRARQDGATVLVGGERPDRPGWFVSPALVAATNDMEIAREEVFGPVAVVIAYDDTAAAPTTPPRRWPSPTTPATAWSVRCGLPTRNGRRRWRPSCWWVRWPSTRPPCSTSPARSADSSSPVSAAREAPRASPGSSNIKPSFVDARKAREN